MSEVFEYKGYLIPVDLINLTGGGTDTWDVIAQGHMWEYQKYMPIEPYHAVLEVGCGVGRDAIQLTEWLNSSGSYVGVDIIRPSIDWCRENISSRYPNFRFEWVNIHSQIHNPTGQLGVRDTTLPVPSSSIDRIFLQSVFTHMFEGDIVHYLRDFQRILRPGGLVFATLFVLDDESIKLARTSDRSGPEALLRFEVPFGDGCFVNDAVFPEGAVGFTPAAIDRMLEAGGFRLTQPIHQGIWCGRQGAEDPQDVAVLEPRPPRRNRRVLSVMSARTPRLGSKSDVTV